ncbi:MAG: hypothetical protein IPJ23_14305 [Ignavibacteriales bacterium]|nr:hypothetical protein [Ignavibacteriales bacterium]
MKKQLIVLFTLVTISIITFTSCEPFIENKITTRNLADGGVILTLRGQAYNIPAGETLILNDFKKGTFAYSTVYELPFGITSATATGDIAGEMKLLAGTEISLVYTSVTDSAKYTLFGVLSSSDDINRADPFETP